MEKRVFLSFFYSVEAFRAHLMPIALFRYYAIDIPICHNHFNICCGKSNMKRKKIDVGYLIWQHQNWFHQQENSIAFILKLWSKVRKKRRIKYGVMMAGKGEKIRKVVNKDTIRTQVMIFYSRQVIWEWKKCVRLCVIFLPDFSAFFLFLSNAYIWLHLFTLVRWKSIQVNLISNTW